MPVLAYLAETRHNPIPYEDSLIGAIARSAGLKVVTRNLKHFRGCAAVDPWTGQEHAPWAPKPSHEGNS